MRAESHHQVKSGDWAEVGGTLLMWETARQEEGKGSFHGWGRGMENSACEGFGEVEQPGHSCLKGFKSREDMS